MLNCTWCSNYSYDTGCLINEAPDKEVGVCINFQRRPSGANNYPCKAGGVPCPKRNPDCRSGCIAYQSAAAETARRRRERKDAQKMYDYLAEQVIKHKG